MSRQYPTDHFIQKKAEVEEADRVAVFQHGGHGVTAFDPGTENVAIAGFIGSGRMELSTKLARTLGLSLVNLCGPDIPAENLERAASEKHLLLVCGATLAASPADLNRVLAGTRLFYIMADAGAFAARAVERGLAADGEEVRQRVVEAMYAAEPMYMSLGGKMLRYEKETDFEEEGDEMHAVTGLNEVDNMAAIVLKGLSGRI